MSDQEGLKAVWVEKYRPKTLNDLCISESTKEKITKYGDEIPNLLFVGNCGTGKTTLAQIIVNDLLKCDYLYINASDESGIDTIRQKVTGFVQTKSFDGGIKVVILDEYDGSSPENQKCLRNLMESYAKYARFIITGNFKHKIIRAIDSRCKAFDIKPLFRESLVRCLWILEQEKIQVSLEQKKELAKLLKRNFPDVRKTIIDMQDACFNGVLEIEEAVNNDEVCEKILASLESKKTVELRKYLIENDSAFNNNHEQLLTDLLNFIYVKKIDDTKKKQMILTIADHLYKMSFVNDKEINFFACILNLETL
jgi:DNA polymerase III delta prime subunit